MTVIHVNNQGCTALTHNLVNHSHAKHIDIKHHFICKCVECGEVTLQYISTKEMLADIFTKKIPCEVFAKFRQWLDIVSLSHWVEVTKYYSFEKFYYYYYGIVIDR